MTFARALGIGLIAILAGISTAAAGPIGFVGLLIPHVMRSTIGPDYRWLLPSCALAGAILLLASDIVGRLIAHPGEVQVGIVLAFVGAPVFIAMMARRRLVRP
nr:iron chelate uptake ABC transporter family permease subunit [Corynebacterium auriscanis]